MEKENSKFAEIQKMIVSHFAGGASADDIAKVIGVDQLTQDSLECLAELVADHMSEDADPDDVAGFDKDVERCANDIIQNESDKLIAKCENPTFEQCDLERGQWYCFVDENNQQHDCSGDIFDFGHHYKAKDEVFFHREDDGTFTPINWFDIPMWSNTDEEKVQYRKNCIFVFDTIVTSNCEVVRLYDYFE